MQIANTREQHFDSSLHLKADQDLIGRFVSSESLWHSDVWRFESHTHGVKCNFPCIKWKVVMRDGSYLTDPKHRILLDWLRRVVWGLLYAPGDGAKHLSPGSLPGVSLGISLVAPWLAEHAIRWPSDLSEEALDHLLADLPSICVESQSRELPSEEAKPRVSTANRAIRLIYFIWRQRESLASANIPPMKSKPWPFADGANSLATRISEHEPGWIEPLPDEVAVPLLNKAMWLMGMPADDILRLRDECAAAYERSAGSHHLGPGTCRDARKKRQQRAAQLFSFSTIEGETSPWHISLKGLKGNDGNSASVLRARRLVLHLQAGCCLILQAFTGMRVSELCSLKPGICETTGLPSEVEIRISPSGLNEEYFVRGEISKGTPFPKGASWLLGSRRRGSNEIPIPVRALIILNNLMSPYLKSSNSDRLLVSLSAPRGLPKSSSGLSRMTGMRIIDMYRSFISDLVDLSQIPNESRHASSPNDLLPWKDAKNPPISTHQLRKSYAKYVLSVNPDLLPAVKRQFHHLNMTITEGSYWGGSSTQIDPIHSVSRQLTAKLLFDATQKPKSVSGLMGTQIEENISSLRKLTKGLDKKQGWRLISKWVTENDIKSHHSPHGVCIPLISTRMECWRRSGRLSAPSMEPNYSAREASICAVCECLAVSEEHVPFWKERFIAYEVANRLSEKHSYRDTFREVRRRLSQARRLLLSMGVDVDALNPIIEERLKSHEIERK